MSPVSPTIGTRESANGRGCQVDATGADKPEPPLLLSSRPLKGSPQGGDTNQEGTAWAQAGAGQAGLPTGQGPAQSAREATEIGLRARPWKPGEGVPTHTRQGRLTRWACQRVPGAPQPLPRAKASRPAQLDNRSAQAYLPSTALGWCSENTREIHLSKRSADGRRGDSPRCHTRRVTKEELSPLVAQGSPLPHQHQMALRVGVGPVGTGEQDWEPLLQPGVHPGLGNAKP